MMRPFIALALAMAATLVSADALTDVPEQQCVRTAERVFWNETAATQSSSYMTFTLVEHGAPYDDCLHWCVTQLSGCKAVNVYLDNYGKGITLPSGEAAQYTCSAFNGPIDISMNTNRGGQDQHGDGHLTSITKSVGFNLL